MPIVLPLLACLIAAIAGFPRVAVADSGVNDWLGVSANSEIGYRKTQFFESDHSAAVALLDARLELWMPPYRDDLAWGPYVRAAIIGSSEDQPWENAWLSAPGFGLQAYPFHSATNSGQSVGSLLSPIRLFAEVNRVDYWGEENGWRPDNRVRAGAELWRERYVQQPSRPTWSEFWAGAIWQSSNEFDDHYDSLVLGASGKVGRRIVDQGIVSAFTPYLSLDTSWSGNDAYYWENNLMAGGGLRCAPRLSGIPVAVTRFIVFAEYLRVVTYYGEKAPDGVPDYDFRAGIGLSFGNWYQ